VPLSEHEQRLLDEIEQALYAEDPKFASAVRSARRRGRVRSSVLLSVLGVLAGLGLVLIGLLANIIVLSVVGFVLLVAGVGMAVQSVRARRAGVAPAGTPNAGRRKNDAGLRSRMEDRLRRRFDES